MNFLDYPKLVAIEVTNHCQMKCLHCPQGHGLITGKGFMDFELFTQIVADVESWRDQAPTPPKIVLYGNGEPLLHKRLPEFVAHCTQHGFVKVLSTNVQLTTPKLARQLSEAGLDLLKLSFWGDTAAEYESRAPRFSFAESVARARAFLDAVSPSVEVVVNIVKYRGINDSLVPRPEFLALFEDYPNVKFYCFFGSDWRGTLDIPDLKVPLEGEPKHEPCKMAGEMCAIAWDGQVTFCWIDYNREYSLGRYTPGSMLDFWRSPERRRRLELMAQGRFKEMPLCQACSAPYSENTKPRYYKDAARETLVVGKHIYDDNFLKGTAQRSR